MSRPSTYLQSALRTSLRATQAHIPKQQWSAQLQCRTFSLLQCRHHEAQIRQQKQAIRQRIRNFELLRRKFSYTAARQHGHLDPPKPGEELHVTFIDKDGEEHTFVVAEGDNLLDIAQANDLEMEGACGGSCACSTCHVIVQDEGMFDKLSEPDDDENDMLDLAFGLTETSRLGCQVKMSKDIDGLVVKLPSMTRNMQASDFGGQNPKHH
ncbi:mitochondrial matrix iron-sulfur protein [Neophaeococcomyces mojaviensis]|uniref:Mitochondrial matrix iron-sulfur protein n=1 Tax=Neophaeococcomyces mojaviensis TaxID=3383035 RepID=A0ACC3A7Y9_9EURO|nr:mitochondrial matrix iron-sulfur protein [Knufia sp. JES_112]